ncbi:DNA polymerase III subunit gamma/tau [Maribrevibacterium harenarium]|uniref:DNA polymerase III subunit gamma/tau n=1 Tax=Maribrevibacterium harenarium TaxID=2589817 RepID=A0A501WJB4_9GAMM|nr:DNA polymerase III subunit gamma/tau [Maribrevibacterium harenarium]TPE48450.1 DNA polymerase III subunit gamma/tau [Maribrevibacterium harenarium]
MSYQVLARKWRPQTFLEMAGQDHVLQALVNALRQQRLHHAYLFTGTRGVGKTTIARIFAKCLNCETNGISPEPCGTCPSCTEIAEGRFVDLIEVDAASRTKVEDTRELLENVQYAPTRGRFKVYLIDEVHMLSTHSFNALLKTLEEPPEHVKFLLATTDPQKLPVTILSRCLQFNLKNMSPQRVVDYLQTVLQAEQVNFEMPALWQIGQAANGSMRDALSLTDQAIAFGDGNISETGVTSMLGLVNQSQILALLDLVIRRDAAAVLSKIAELADYQPDFSAIAGTMLDALHRIAIEQQVPGALMDQTGDLATIRQMAASLGADELQMMYQSLMIGKRDLPLAHTTRAGFEMLMLRLIAFRPAGPVTPIRHIDPEMVTAAKPAETPITSAPVSVPSAEPAPGETSETLGALSEHSETVATPTRAEVPAPLEVPKENQVADAVSETEMLPEQAATSTSNADIDQDIPPPWDDEEVAYAASAFESLPEEPVAAPPATATAPVTPEPVAKRASSDLSAMLDKVQEPSDELSDEEEDELAIATTEDPYAQSAALVEELEQTATSEEAVADGREVLDSVSQPALGMPVPAMSHFKELDMQRWWLVAPRLQLTGLVYNIAMNSSLVSATEQGIRLQVPLEYGHMLNQQRYEQIMQALADFFSMPVPLIIDTVAEVDGVTAEEFAVSKRAEKQQQAIAHIQTLPIAQALKSQFDAQLIYDSVKAKV